MTTAGRVPAAVVFDLGNVLVDWDPRHLYVPLFDGDRAVAERFLSEVCTPDWHHELDRGRDWSDAIAERVARFPGWETAIAAYRDRWDRMFAGDIAGSVTLLRTLQARGVAVHALSNYPAEPVDFLYRRFDWMTLFDTVVISGRLGLVKPDPAIYRHLLTLIGLPADRCLFIDDRADNVAAARALGFDAVRFEGAPALRESLVVRGLPVDDAPGNVNRST